MLAQGLDRILDELLKMGINVPIADPGDLDLEPLNKPIEVEFDAQSMGLAWNEMTELITSNELDYKKLAIRLAEDKILLNNINSKLQEKILTAPLFDPISNTRHIENAFLEMYRKYQAGEEPSDFSIN